MGFLDCPAPNAMTCMGYNGQGIDLFGDYDPYYGGHYG